MAQRFDSKIEEVKSEMKFLTGRIEWVNTESRKLESREKSIKQTASWKKFITHSPPLIWLLSLLVSSRPLRGTNNRHLIDSMHMKLEQTNKKLGEVKSKCTKAVKSCLRMQMESVSRRSLIELWRVLCGKGKGKMKRKWKLLVGGRKKNFPFYFDFYYFSAHTWGSLFSHFSIVRRSTKVECTDTNFLFIFLRHLRHPARKDLWSCRGQHEEIIHEGSSRCAKKCCLQFQSSFCAAIHRSDKSSPFTRENTRKSRKTQP